MRGSVFSNRNKTKTRYVAFAALISHIAKVEERVANDIKWQSSEYTINNISSSVLCVISARLMYVRCVQNSNSTNGFVDASVC